MKKKKLTEKDKELVKWLKEGGRDEAKKDLQDLIKLASQPSEKLPRKSP